MRDETKEAAYFGVCCKSCSVSCPTISTASAEFPFERRATFYRPFIVTPIVIGSNTIERVMTYKLLGVYVSNDLKWNHHVEVIVQKENRRLYSLRV